MKILFVLNQLPYPPRNGVTIPSYNYLRGLSESHEVSLLFLKDAVHQYSGEDIESNRRLVRHLWVIEARKTPWTRRAIDEIRGRGFFHIGRAYDEDRLAAILHENKFDAVWVSDESLLDIIRVLRKYIGVEPKIVAAIHDCITLVFRQSKEHVFRKGGSLTEKMKSAIKWIRSYRAGKIEFNLLKDYDLIQVQSDADRAALSRISSQRLDPKIIVLSNGVESRLFANEISTQTHNVLFVGSLWGYSKIVVWLIEEVWPAIKARYPDAVFHVIGRGASQRLREVIRGSAGVVHTEFVADIADVYMDKAVSLSPVFKEYGLINKVVESMAAGVPVVADKGGFGNIPGFHDGRHGVIANDAQGMADAVIELLGSKDRRKAVAIEARDLVMRNFQWQARVRQLTERLESQGVDDQ